MNSPAQREDATPAFPAGAILLTVRCQQCGYNLKGVDPAGACPECGAAAWPSLRPIVDPADVRLALLNRPRRLGVCLVMVTMAMLLSAALLWWPYLLALVRRIRSPGAPLMGDVTIGHYVLIGVLAGAALLATFCLQRPTGAAAPRDYRRGLNLARGGLICWALLHGAVLFYDVRSRQPVNEWVDLVHANVARSVLRLALDAAALAMIVGFRPVVLLLARYSVPHRLGGASRQGFLAIFVLLGVILLGDALRLISAVLDSRGLAGAVVDNSALSGAMLLLIGSAMLLLALLNLLIDSSRMARNLARPLYRLDEVIG